MKFTSCLFLSLALPLGAAELDRAMSLPKRTANAVFRDRLTAHWLPGGKSFWYHLQTGSRTHEYVLIRAETGQRQTAPDWKSLALPEPEALRSSQLSLNPRKTQRTGDEALLRIVNQLDTAVTLAWVNQQGEQIRYGEVGPGQERQQPTFAGHVWHFAAPDGAPLALLEASAPQLTLILDGKGRSPSPASPERLSAGQLSPDGKWTVSVQKGLLSLNGEILNVDAKGFRGPVFWAPDSSAFVVSRCDDVSRRKVTLIDSSPRGQVQPKLKVTDYAKPGDPLPHPDLFIVRPGGPAIRVASELFPNPFTQADHLHVTWAPDSSEFFFDYNQRGHQLYRILAASPRTGVVRTVVEETSKTFIDYTKKTWRHWLHPAGELLWMSERDGWCHLWLYDARTGKVKNQVTNGAWPVREVLHVDEESRQVWFLASGLRPGEDPYHLHLCRANLDGSGFARLTEGDGNHRIEFSPDRLYFIDRWSRADLPPVHELRLSRDGSLVCELEKAEAGQLLDAGWTLPERFVAKGRDGRTDIHGVIIRPSRFDPSQKYPVVEEIYAGPHGASAPKDFGPLMRQHQVAELGFVVVQLDGMGTNHRGKAFHDVCWKNLKDAGFPDRIAWMKEAAKTRPWMDLTRVGIYGGSAGGQNAMRALLDHSDFYRVAVADCGCHDNRMDKLWWNEQWMGWPVDESYRKNSNVEDAHKLQGRLLLIAGELDTNVDPASTLQVVGALQKAGKAFDFMLIIGAGHGAAETPYGSRLRMEFLVRHLRP